MHRLYDSHVLVEVLNRGIYPNPIYSMNQKRDSVLEDRTLITRMLYVVHMDDTNSRSKRVIDLIVLLHGRCLDGKS